MRFVVQHRKADFIKSLILLFSISIYFYVFVFLIYRYEGEFLFPDQVLRYIKGNPDEFLEPVPFVSLLEEIHIFLFINIFLLLSISSVLFRATLSEKIKTVLPAVGFLLINLEPLSKIAIFYGYENFSYISFISLILYILLVLVINTMNVYFFLTGRIK
ncbi:hypothetical protein [Persephonella sp.]